MKSRVRRTVLTVLAVAGVLVLLNQIISFPMAFRMGDWKEWLGGPRDRASAYRAYRLLDEMPASDDRPNLPAAAESLEKEQALATGTTFPDSVTLGDEDYWFSNRPALVAPAPSYVSYRVTVPEKSYLTFGYSVKRFLKGKLQGPARFIVKWKDEDGEKVIFDDVVSPGPLDFWEKDDEWQRIWKTYVSPLLVKKGEFFRQAEVDLSSFAGEIGEVIFVTENVGEPKGDYSPAVWSNPEIWSARPPELEPPMNVVLFMIESTSYDMIEPDGRTPQVTPHIIDFAGRSTMFEKFYTVGDSTKLSVYPFFTGRHFHSLGMPFETYMLGPMVKKRYYRKGFTSMSEAFSKAGYKTVQFGSNHYFIPTRDFGLDLGFDRQDVLRRRYMEHYDNTLAMLEWLGQNSEKPFFLYVHYDSPHDPEKPLLEDLVDAIFAGGPYSDWRTRKYLGQLIRADKDFKILMDALEMKGVLDRTLVVVTADHGKCVDPAHNFAMVLPSGKLLRTPLRHGRSMVAEEVRVPFIIHVPGQSGPERISAPTASIDLFPTLVELAIQDPAPRIAAGMKDLAGTSLVPLMNGEPVEGDYRERVIYTISKRGESVVLGGEYRYSIRRPGFDRILYPGDEKIKIVKESVYDIENDPRELTELSDESPELLDRMRRVFEKARPSEDTVSILFINYERGKLEAEIGLNSHEDITQTLTFPFERPPVVMNAMKEGSTAGGMWDGSIFNFETDLEGPTGIVLEDPVKWASISLDGEEITNEKIRIGPYGLPFISTTAGHHPPARIMLEDNDLLGPSVMQAKSRPMAYIDLPGVYFYTMTFSDFVSVSFSDKGLSSDVKAILKEWGYIDE